MPENQPLEQTAYVFPASYAQERLWFLDQLQPNQAVYTMPEAFRLVGPLNDTALELSIQALVQRHESLRTSFSAVDGQPVQVITPTLVPTTQVVDLGERSRSEREAEARRLVNEESLRSFDLGRGPLLRTILIRLGQDEHVLIVNMHHIISDAWSWSVFYRELAELYEAFCAGRANPLRELPIQYADYASWQRQLLQGEGLQPQLEYWKRQLAGSPTVMELPTDHPRPTVQSFRGAEQVLVLSSTLTDGLKKLSRQEGATLFMTLLAAFATLLCRYAAQKDIVVGTPIANRTRTEVEDLIGFFVNSLALRTNLAGNPTFRELLGRVRGVCLDAYANQEVPFDKIVEELQPERDLSRNPIFQVMFTLQNTQEQPLILAGLEVSPMPIVTHITNFDLNLSLQEVSGEISGTLRYSTDLFEAATIHRMLTHFKTLVAGIITYPGQRIAQLPLLTEAERHQQLVRWNDTHSDYDSDACIHELFEAQADRTPEAVAVVFQDEKLTYQQLNCQANQLAHWLRKQGVGPEIPVGLHIPRSCDLIAAVLAVLKAGGAFLPLDVDYPTGRLANMLAQAEVPLLLTQEHKSTDLPSHVGRTILLDQIQNLVVSEPPTNPQKVATSQNLAYIVFTSGSTGQPKGIQASHRGAVNYLTYLVDTFGLSERSIALQLPSFSFDAAIRDMIGPLLAGGRVVLLSQAQVGDPGALAAKIRLHGINSLLSIVPSMLRSLMRTAGNDTLLGGPVDLVLVSGEQLYWSDWREAQHVFGPEVRIVNQFGPSESTMTCTYFPLDEAPGDQEAVPIGRPIPNMQVYVLDNELNPVPVGVPGEVYIGGPGLARGYLNQPGLTATAFLPHPFSSEPGARLYRAGDLARATPDGLLRFIGRTDHQVKVRGVRVELGEVEAVLSSHPSVREAIVLLREDTPGDQRLVAYLVAHAEPSPSPGELSSFLGSRLPRYMVPSVWVMLDSLPLTANRKIARRALPVPDYSRMASDHALVPPRTSTEEALAGIWLQVLRVPQVGVYDSFFELGGHSLLATQVMSRIRSILGVNLPLRLMFETPTIAGLAVAVEEHRTETQALAWPVIPISSRDSRRARTASTGPDPIPEEPNETE